MNHDYNTQRKRMALPEYGRNVQKMIDYIKTIEDRDERNRAARTIIKIMGNLNPHLRDYGDINHKLWDHITIIAQFELDIDAPYPPPEKEKLNEKPMKVDYQNGEVRYLHYGRVVEMMISVAVDMEEGEKREFLVLLIANQMKKAAASWNRGIVSDEVIFKDISELSNNKLKVPEGTRLLDVKDLIGPKKKKQTKQQGGKQSKKKYHSRH
jgi:hypothetical protein